MAVSTSDTITAAQFNNLQSRIAQVLGTGSGDFGYGQTVSSQQVSAPSESGLSDADLVTAQQLNNLRADMNNAFLHQNGTAIGINIINQEDIIGADQTASSVVLDSNNNITAYVDSNSSNGFNDFVSTMSDLESNRFIIHPSQQDVQVIVSDIRNTDWNGTIISEFAVNFENSDLRRFFFNAGGQIRIAGAVDLSTSTGDSLARDTGWNDIIENPGEIHFFYNSTTITGSTAGVSFPSGAIGNDSLTNSYQTIFRKDANSGLYSNSYWKIEAKENSAASISFKIILVDSGPESDDDSGEPGAIAGGIVEPITANLEFDYSIRRANGSVVVPAPAIQLLDTFE